MLLKERRSKVSHCSVSNTSLSSDLCPVKQLLNDGIEVGLRTDVGEGYSASILVAVREATMISRTLAALTPKKTKSDETSRRGAEAIDNEVTTKHSTDAKDRKKLSVKECLHLATKGGVRCLGLKGKMRGFGVRKQWDAQLIELEDIADDAKNRAAKNEKSKPREPMKLWGKKTWGEKVAKRLFWAGTIGNTKKAFVGRRLMHERR